MEQFLLPSVAQRFDRVAGKLAEQADLPEDIAARLMSRLSFIKHKPAVVLDIGCGTGALSKAIHALYPEAKIIGADISSKSLATYPYGSQCAAATVLPFPDHYADLLVSNLMLPWCNDLSGVFSEMWRVLKVGGVCLFSSFGPDTLIELREAWAKVDDKPHVHVHWDMHDVGDRLLSAGFEDPVMDVERVSLQYTSLPAMFNELKQLGWTNLHVDRQKGLMGKAKWQAFQTALGVPPYTVSLELVFGHGVKAEQKTEAPNEFTFSLEALRNTLRR
ncbi:MAG: malonyl-[acyl-carrier protein] O-methyltransferase BioC [Gammaproteobacteria bacterium CG11_big_fil_rev_8_21_14_0_20_46_22]|nr:MAG: malonyl-[acyl-carrier protein] O-methyltransferase BioC [Gammaproteobacteria bacterium CG12_big_fil_rev_8_21_14_0_65_46_12]PIR10642.1 MAG: malonyl-[acyl-carrier protein] O-methyltransferase BioC [Gammaproteobacteria bacterium CG11_big_fil_rev_8_21_14_0_20_46_22]